MTGILGAVALALAVPAVHEIADHLSAQTSAGVARWAFALLALVLVHLAFALYLWQAPDWGSVFAVAVLELALAMTLAFVLALLVSARSDHRLVQWLQLDYAARSDLARWWCLLTTGLASGTAFWCGRHALAWRRRLATGTADYSSA